MNIILLAPPAAGKGTQSALLESTYNLAHISTGDLLREALKQDTKEAKELHDIIASGKLVDDDVILDLIENTLTHLPMKKSYILDGFPRTINQAKKYDLLLDRIDQKIDYVLVLDVDKEILKKRIVGRLLCKKCGSIFNEYFEVKKPQKKGICDFCNSTLTKRSDDNEESFEKRYQVYLKETKPLIDYYQKKGILHHVPFCETPDQVFREIQKIIGEKYD